MSTDWNKYSTSLETLNRAGNPPDNIVITFAVDEVRRIVGQTIAHNPVNPDETSRGNRAHADVPGAKTTEARLKFLRICKPAGIQAGA